MKKIVEKRPNPVDLFCLEVGDVLYSYKKASAILIRHEVVSVNERENEAVTDTGVRIRAKDRPGVTREVFTPRFYVAHNKKVSGGNGYLFPPSESITEKYMVQKRREVIKVFCDNLIKSEEMQRKWYPYVVNPEKDPISSIDDDQANGLVTLLSAVKEDTKDPVTREHLQNILVALGAEVRVPKKK